MDQSPSADRGGPDGGGPHLGGPGPGARVQALAEVDHRLVFEIEPVARWAAVRPGTRILSLLILAWKRRRRGEWLPAFPWIPIAGAWLVGAVLAVAVFAVALILRAPSTPLGG